LAVAAAFSSGWRWYANPDAEGRQALAATAILPRRVALVLPAGSVHRSPARAPALALALRSSDGFNAKDCSVSSLPATLIDTSPRSEMSVVTSTTFLPTRYLNTGGAVLFFESRE
jgi:hypothetical protein